MWIAFACLFGGLPTRCVRTCLATRVDGCAAKAGTPHARKGINTAHEEESWARSPRAGAAKAGMASRTRINCRKAGLVASGCAAKGLTQRRASRERRAGS